MVSHVDYTKTPALIYRKGRFVLVLAIIAMILLISVFSMWFVFAMIAVYILAGLILYLVKLIRKKNQPVRCD
jgi:Ca2+/Na+ antiporter